MGRFVSVQRKDQNAAHAIVILVTAVLPVRDEINVIALNNT